jgi:release factor glutamine methyltransferase
LVTAGSVLNEIKNRFKNAGIENYTFESRCIVESALNISHASLLANPDKPVADEDEALICTMANRRLEGYPLQYIIGKWEFFGLPFFVGEGVLIPRQDTETLVECVLNDAANLSCPRILDLCSGSGCIPVALDKHLKNADIAAVEFSSAALDYLNMNISLNSSSVKVYNGDVLDPEYFLNFSDIDIITSNPPYLTDEDMANLQKEVAYEPEMALAGGSDGLMFYKVITTFWKHCLKPGGRIYYEIGIHQEDDVSQILTDNGFTNVQTYPDLCGVIRVVSGVYNGSTMF